MTITKTSARGLAEQAESALQAVAERNGLTVKYKGGSYTGTTFTPKFEFATADSAAVGFARDATFIGLTPEDFGKEVKVEGRIIKIVGINLRASRYPVLVEDRDGKVYKYNEGAILKVLGR